VLSKRELITLLRNRPQQFDAADLRYLAAATSQRLKVLRGRAREGKCVDEASEFARWLTSCGLLKLFGDEARMEVQDLVRDTVHDCECHWRNQGQGPWVAKSELEAVNAKLDNLASMMAFFAQGKGPEDQAPALAVVECGAAS
jgi:hypothetical protein